MNLTKYIAEQFGRPVGIGGKISTLIMNMTNQKQYNTVIQKLNISASEKILDIGFGNGYLIHKLAERFKALFWGIDVSEDMLHTATKRNKRAIKQGNMKLQVGNVSEMEYEACFFDKIYTVNTIYFWSDINTGLSEIRRVLKTGGIFVNAVYSKKFLDSLHHTNYLYKKYTKEELEEAIHQNGFEILEAAEIKKDMSYCYVLKKI